MSITVPGRATRRALTCAAVLGLLATGQAVVLSDAAHGDATDVLSSATMFGQPGDGFLDGRPQILHSPVDTFSVRGDTGTETVTVEIYGDASRSLSSLKGDFTFSAPRGEALRVGSYEAAMDDPFRDEGRPGILISSDEDGGCVPQQGRFDVRDIAFTEGKVSRLRLLYEFRCMASALPVFGEVRLGVDRPAGPLLVTPGLLPIPRTMPGALAPPVRVTAMNDSTGPATPGAPAITGPDAAAFTVLAHTCGEALPAGSACTADVRFAPDRTGSHVATLTFPGAPEQPVALEGMGDTGRTSWRLFRESDQPFLNGYSESFAAHEAVFEGFGGHSEALLELYLPPYESAYTAEFRTGDSTAFEAGRTYTYDAATFEATAGDVGTGSLLVRDRSSCTVQRGSFTVHEVERSAAGLERASISFEQQCQHLTGVLRGTLDYRATAEPVSASVDASRMRPWFTDIDGTTHADAIGSLSREGHVDGYADGTFRPHLPVDRGQGASLLARALRLPAAQRQHFTDTAGSTHRRSIDAVAEAAITAGYGDGTFRPDGPVTRGQAATFLVRALALPRATAGGFSDTALDVHAADIDALAAAGMASGYPDGSFRPGDTVTRGQLAALLARGLSLRP